MDSTNILSTLITALIGMAVVFAVLILLMLFISVMSKLMKGGKKAKATPAVQASGVQTPSAAPQAAKGSCGEVKLFEVPDKIAAQIMAITAEKLGKPLNTLRFVSIKEVK